MNKTKHPVSSFLILPNFCIRVAIVMATCYTFIGLRAGVSITKG